MKDDRKRIKGRQDFCLKFLACNEISFWIVFAFSRSLLSVIQGGNVFRNFPTPLLFEFNSASAAAFTASNSDSFFTHVVDCVIDKK